MNTRDANREIDRCHAVIREYRRLATTRSVTVASRCVASLARNGEDVSTLNRAATMPPTHPPVPVRTGLGMGCSTDHTGTRGDFPHARCWSGCDRSGTGISGQETYRPSPTANAKVA